MPTVEKPHYQAGDFLVDYEEKVFEDVQAPPGAKALLTFHTVAFEGSIGLVTHQPIRCHGPSAANGKRKRLYGSHLDGIT